MSTSVKGDLHSWDTKDKRDLWMAPGKYKYTVSASDGGKLRFKVKYYSGDQYSPYPGDGKKGNWYTLVKREKVDSGASLSGSFNLPESLSGWPVTQLRLIFSRGAATKGVDYNFSMDLA
jgi:hypothetical protein